MTRAHRARLLQIWRSAGWPHRDALDLDLLAAALVTAVWTDRGHETLRITPTGIDWLAAARHATRRSAGPHDRLAERVACKLMESGRLVWRELSLRARVNAEGAEEPSRSTAPGDAAIGQALDVMPALGPLDVAMPTVEMPPPGGSWRLARPDVFSVRNTSVEAYLHPVVHEIKVSRADLLGDLRNPAKRQAYAWLCCECYYVFPAGIASPDEIPPDFGVWLLHGSVDDGHLERVRPARHAACQLPFAVWMALARSTPSRIDPQDASQAELGDG